MSGDFLNVPPFNSERTVFILDKARQCIPAERLISFIDELAALKRLLERKNEEAKASTSEECQTSCKKKRKSHKNEKEKKVKKISDEAPDAYLMEKFKYFIREEKNRARKRQRNEDESGSRPRTPEFLRSRSKSPGYRSRSPELWSPNRDPRHRSLDYEPRRRNIGYDPRHRTPGYDHRPRSPGYEPRHRSPGYNPRHRSPGYDLRQRIPGNNPWHRSPDYNPWHRSPGYNPRHRSPDYDHLRRSLDYALEYRNPEYEVKPNVLDEPWRMPEARGRGFPSPENLTFPNNINIKAEKGTLPDAFYCQVCQLSLNSELTWNTHIRGKKHAKAVNAQEVHEIAKRSIAVPFNTPPISQEAPRFIIPAAGRKRVLVRDVSRIQQTVEEHMDHPMPGLNSILEVRMDNETSYYCELCDSPCAASSIMPHLIGFKHQLRCIKEILPDHYDKVKDRPKKSIEHSLIKLLYKHERHYGKGYIKVFEDVPEFSAKPNSSENGSLYPPGPNSGIVGKQEVQEESEKIAMKKLFIFIKSIANFLN